MSKHHFGGGIQTATPPPHPRPQSPRPPRSPAPASPGHDSQGLKSPISASNLSASLAAAAAAYTCKQQQQQQQAQRQPSQQPQYGHAPQSANVVPGGYSVTSPTRDRYSSRGSPHAAPKAYGGNGSSHTYRSNNDYFGQKFTTNPHAPHPYSLASAQPYSTPSPLLKAYSTPVSMPVQIPTGGTHSQRDLLSSSTSTPSSDEYTGSATEMDKLSRAFSCNARMRDEQIGIKRPRHSLSVNIVRRRGNSLDSSPVTSGSYSSLNQSPAVSFLAGLADSSVRREAPPGDYTEGDQVGDFILGHQIGTGAFSRVYEADVIDGPHKMLGKVAVKIVIKDPAHIEAEQDLQRLINHETTIWARLRHPHILEMLELMDADDAVFVVSELAGAGNLLDMIKRHGRLPEHYACKIFGQVASALRYLHEEIQVVHRDVKCENILLDDEGNAKLADFGLSAEMTPEHRGGDPLHGGPPTTTTNKPNEPVYLMGSLHYCSPEELRQTTLCSPAADMWSLGCVLYAMLTGTLPFNDGFAPRLQMMIMNGKWDEAKLDKVGVSEAGKSVVRGLLRVKVAERWGMGELWKSEWLMAPSE
ncbi:kinase-like domain-containing protein [Fimicolochytrium jonesii]|uniref:kinase-like domain-containing protein n=1 Tax=Fimicolochytrium jonesii TaxID=1396493 RepID=UPI0022FEDD62|nr:kinase-like domain-containing protein [Fimicolochytrium jonesii]KAI8820417.1 kinase-like domain-containing protein [Fimicolochytrium jonesii]